MQQARLLQEQEDEADGEEDDEDDDEEQDDMWRRRRRGSPEGRPEAMGQSFPEEPLRRRVVGNRQEAEEDEEDT